MLDSRQGGRNEIGKLITFVLLRPAEAVLGTMEAQVRTTIGTILVIGTAAISPVQAQTYDPRYPVCMQRYTRDGTSIGCGFTSLAQCQESASGLAAQCYANPYYAHATRKASRRASQRPKS
jgi:hypothetical protein